MVLKGSQKKGDVHAAPLSAVLRLQLPPGGSQGMDSTTRGLTKYLKGYFMWYMKNHLLLLSVPPFAQVMNFRTEPAIGAFVFKPVPCPVTGSPPRGDTSTF